jgi:hypothetical protein
MQIVFQYGDSAAQFHTTRYSFCPHFTTIACQHCAHYTRRSMRFVKVDSIKVSCQTSLCNIFCCRYTGDYEQLGTYTETSEHEMEGDCYSRIQHMLDAIRREDMKWWATFWPACSFQLSNVSFPCHREVHMNIENWGPYFWGKLEKALLSSLFLKSDTFYSAHQSCSSCSFT